LTTDFGFRLGDIPVCTRYAFSARKIWIFFKALLLSWLVWDIFAYLGFFAAGGDLEAKWRQARFLPLPGPLFGMDTAPGLILALGVILILYIFMRASLMVSKVTFQQIRGDDFFSTADAAAFAGRHGTPLFTVPLMLVFTILFLLAVPVVMGALSRIPAVGPVIAALASVPLWGLMLLCLLTAVGLYLSLGLVPSVVATTRGDTFEAVFEVFSTLTSQPWRLLFYIIVAKISLLVVGVLFLVFSSLALEVLDWAFSLGSGNSMLVSSMAAGPRMIAPELLPHVPSVLPVFFRETRETWEGMAGILAALSGTAVILILVSYFLAGLSAAWTIIYVVLKFRKDRENLLERADREDQREFDRICGASKTDRTSTSRSGV